MDAEAISFSRLFGIITRHARSCACGAGEAGEATDALLPMTKHSDTQKLRSVDTSVSVWSFRIFMGKPFDYAIYHLAIGYLIHLD